MRSKTRDDANFRIYFDDGTKIIVKAGSPELARKIAKKKNSSPITKIKRTMMEGAVQ